MKKVVLATLAHNQHIQNVARAIYEAGALKAYYTGGVDHFQHPWSKGIRSFVGRVVPAVNGRLARRRVQTVPEQLVYADWTWEGLRTVFHQLSVSECTEDWIWEKSEHSFDRRCAASFANHSLDGFIGVEYGCLNSLQACREQNVKSVVAFLSPHHSVLQETVFAEYDEFPELRTPYVKRLLRLAPQRNTRKDSEAALADCIHTASEFTAQSLVKAGFPREKMTVVPLGCPSPILEDALPAEPANPTRFMFAGTFSVLKGAHYLLQAWRHLAPGSRAELHVYGLSRLPKRCLDETPQNIIFHGPVSPRELVEAYQQSTALVFPTLCDGFGMVAAEAFAHGLPVLMTANAGAADLIESGKNGFIVPAKNAEALAERMNWCIQHPKELLEMRRHALVTARRNTWAEFRASFLKQSARVLGISWN